MSSNETIDRLESAIARCQDLLTRCHYIPSIKSREEEYRQHIEALNKFEDEFKSYLDDQATLKDLDEIGQPVSPPPPFPFPRHQFHKDDVTPE